MASPFTWDARALRYRDTANGRYIPEARVRQAVDAAVDAASQRMANLTEGLRAGRINAIDWQVGMAREVRKANTEASAAAHGGVKQMSASDLGRTGRTVRTQLDYLRNFVRDVESGKQPLDGRAVQRARMYGQAARSGYEEQRRRLHGLKGRTEERRLLSAAESCVDCVAAAARGWQPEGALPRIGESICLTNCKCSFGFRYVEERVAA